MNCSELAAKIELLHPEADALEVARMAALICSSTNERGALRCHETFLDVWDETNLRIQAATDQHAAATEELTELENFDPRDFTSEQIWVLIRSIKVQNQLLKLYVGDPVTKH